MLPEQEWHFRFSRDGTLKIGQQLGVGTTMVRRVRK